MSLITCEQADAGCEGRTHKRCFSCGTPRCDNCTMVLSYYHYGSKRLCHTCIEDRIDDLIKTVTRKELQAMIDRGIDFERLREQRSRYDPPLPAFTLKELLAIKERRNLPVKGLMIML